MHGHEGAMQHVYQNRYVCLLCYSIALSICLCFFLQFVFICRVLNLKYRCSDDVAFLDKSTRNALGLSLGSTEGRLLYVATCRQFEPDVRNHVHHGDDNLLWKVIHVAQTITGRYDMKFATDSEGEFFMACDSGATAIRLDGECRIFDGYEIGFRIMCRIRACDFDAGVDVVLPNPCSGDGDTYGYLRRH